MSDGIKILNHGSLFSGIGGFDLAAEWIGWDNIFHCEFNPFCQRILKHYFPKAISYEDIRTTDFSIQKGNIDILTGGFPCQPYSLAGKRLGKEDERHLWPSMLRAIREIRPRWVVAENVLGLVSWNAGMVFEEVQSDLEAEGYQVQPFVLPAAGVNAPHRRERVWFIAYSGLIGRLAEWRNSEWQNQNTALGTDIFSEPERPGQIGFAADADHRQQPQQQKCDSKDRQSTPETWSSTGPCAGGRDIGRDAPEGIRQLESDTGLLQKAPANAAGFGCNDGSYHRAQRQVHHDQRVAAKDQSEREGRQRRSGQIGSVTSHVADANGAGTQGRQASGNINKSEPHSLQHAWGYDQPSDWRQFPAQSPVCYGNDGFPGGLDGITFPKWRSETIKAGGNAIVPQVALQIFRTIKTLDKQFQNDTP
ncbi:DNA cytosine methyltransferase [Mucilaginibacter ximonensis]|uniref:Cytosine-specific methyltransferase n=1 Tax=Mucilaginibacter ximonensis TaxID=538021 RepID=A0ABW5YCT7_9SPHI